MDSVSNAQLRADKISELFPPLALAYSCLMNAQSHRMHFDDLYNQIMKYPRGPDCAEIYLLPDEAKRIFNSEEVRFLQPIRNYVDFHKEDLADVLNTSYLYRQGEDVVLAFPPEMDVERSLRLLRAVNPDLSEVAFESKAKNFQFTCYFHKRQIPFTRAQIPSNIPAADWLSISFNELTAENVLLSVFCYLGKTRILLTEYIELSFTLEFRILESNQRFNTAFLVKNVFKVVENSFYFQFVEKEIVLFPPLLMSEALPIDQTYRFRPGLHEGLSSPHETGLVHHEDEGYSMDKERSRVKIDFQEIERTVQAKSFTKRDVFELICGRWLDAANLTDGLVRSDSPIGIPSELLDEVNQEIDKWIDSKCVIGDGRRDVRRRPLPNLIGVPIKEKMKREMMACFVDKCSHLKSTEEFAYKSGCGDMYKLSVPMRLK
jgi:hypothetical protein